MSEKKIPLSLGAVRRIKANEVVTIKTQESKANASDMIRLNKRMGELRICSRREADDWIAKGWIRVNGQVVQMGCKVRASDNIVVDQSAKEAQNKLVTILYHKPLGVVSGQAEDDHIPAVQMIKAANRWAKDPALTRFTPSQLKHLVPAGRLDIDSTGLLVLTQDGRIASSIIGERVIMEKEYLVRVAWTGAINRHAADSAQATYEHLLQDDLEMISTRAREKTPDRAIAQLQRGLTLDGKILRPCQVVWINDDQLRFILTEGKKRQIRRMCELVGLKVLALKRVRIGCVALGNLPQGQWRYLSANEQF